MARCAQPCRRLTIVPIERANGDIGLSSGWQGDSSGTTAPGPNNDYVVVPVAKNPDGSAITGRVMGKGVVADFFPQVAEKGYQLVYGATANLFTDRAGNYIGFGP